jgi:hypothetical protein
MSLAEYISKKTGLETDSKIVQTNEIHRSGKDSWYRLAFRAKFDGNVQVGTRHILIDDVFAYGGTLNELRLFIEKRGGTVAQMATLTLGNHGNIIALQPKTRDILLYKFKENNLVYFLKDKEINLYDGNYNNLTEPEARLIGNTQNLAERGSERLNAVRNSLIAARRVGNGRVVQETLRQRDTTTVTQGVTHPKPSRGFHR